MQCYAYVLPLKLPLFFLHSVRCLSSTMAAPRGVIRLRAASSIAVSVPPPSTSQADGDNQVWIGSVPSNATESQAIAEIMQRGLPAPTKIVIRQSHGSSLRFGIAYFRCKADAATFLAGRMVWSSGAEANPRLAYF